MAIGLELGLLPRMDVLTVHGGRGLRVKNQVLTPDRDAVLGIVCAKACAAAAYDVPVSEAVALARQQ